MPDSDYVLELCNELKKDSNRNWSLNLERNERISSIGYRYLVDILYSTVTIIELSVRYNAMNEKSRTSLLKISLEKLDFNQNSIGNRSYTSLLSSIPPTLTDLLLDYNQITKSSLQTILTFLAAN
jgi:hypothetical protein